MTAEDETAIRAWLALIEETDSATIAAILHQCAQDADARNYFTRRAAAGFQDDLHPREGFAV